MTLGGEKEKFQIIHEFIQNPGQETTFEICNTIGHDVFCVGLNTSRMLKKSASFVLAALGGSTYRTEYASPPRLLRSRWTSFLTILRAVPMPFLIS